MRVRSVASRAILALTGAALLAAGAGAGLAGASRDALTIYAVATKAQFMDHSDERTAGAANNPFNADTKALAPASAKKEKGNGPFPGDDVLYQYTLYADPSLKRSIGTAQYNCVYNFNKHALCEGSLQVTGGSLFVTGPIDYSGQDFTLAVTGGAGKYLGARGEVDSSSPAKSAAKNEHRLEIVFG